MSEYIVRGFVCGVDGCRCGLTYLVRHRQRQADLVGRASGIGVGTAGDEGSRGLSPEGESGDPEGVHGDESGDDGVRVVVWW